MFHVKQSKIKMVEISLSDLIPDPQNARKHDRQNIMAIAASLQQFKQRKPIVVDADGIIRAGNGTYLAAVELGWESLLAIRWNDLKDAEAKGYALADNKTGDLSSFIPSMLDSILEEVIEAGIPLESMGFDEPEFRVRNAKPQQEISPELFERHDYMVFVFDNDLDFQVAEQRFGLKTVKSKKMGSSTIIHSGKSRVLTGKKLLEMTNE